MLHPALESLPTPELSALPGECAAAIDIRVDAARNLVTYTLSGFLSDEVARDVPRRQAEVYAALRCPHNEHLAIVDISACKLQPQEVVETFRQVLANPQFASRRLAVVVGGSLARMQIRRVLVRDGVTYVGTLQEAEAWLFAD